MFNISLPTRYAIFCDANSELLTNEVAQLLPVNPFAKFSNTFSSFQTTTMLDYWDSTAPNRTYTMSWRRLIVMSSSDPIM